MLDPVTSADWEGALDRWLDPFLDRLQRAEQRHWAPLYVEGLLRPAERKSVTRLAEQVAPGDSQQLHHFVSTSPWDPAPLETLLVRRANRRVGGKDAVLIIDDTALVKQGKHSVGVMRQYCGELGKRANCQVLVSLTLARAEMPVPMALRLYLPKAWTDDPSRHRKAGARFGCVLADADYGMGAAFRRGLSERRLRYAVGILPT